MTRYISNLNIDLNYRYTSHFLHFTKVFNPSIPYIHTSINSLSCFEHDITILQSILKQRINFTVFTNAQPILYYAKTILNKKKKLNIFRTKITQRYTNANLEKVCICKAVRHTTQQYENVSQLIRS